jgi:hypothetical protein
MPKTDESVVAEFARAIADSGGPDAMAARISEARGWNQAWSAVIEAVDLIPQDSEHTVHRFTAETIARFLYKAMQARGIDAMWPLRFGQP